MKLARYLESLGGQTHWYANASNAYKDLLVFLKERAGRSTPNVVIPSYLPAKLYRASLAAGCQVRFYEIHGACIADLDHLRRLIDESTVALLHIHYFGFPQQVEEVAAIARERGTTLIEDCALTIGASHSGQLLGTRGDAALFSLRKMFLFSEGSFLRLGEKLAGFVPRYERRVSSLFSLRQFLRQQGKYAYMRLTGGADPLRLLRYDPVGYMDFSAPQALSVKNLSAFSQARAALLDVSAAVEARRRNFLLIRDRFPRGPSHTPLFEELPEGTVPYSFPFLVKDGSRDDHRRELLRMGVIAGAGWPESPFQNELRRSRVLSNSLLELPLHQALTRSQVLRSLNAMERIAARS